MKMRNFCNNICQYLNIDTKDIRVGFNFQESNLVIYDSTKYDDLFGFDIINRYYIDINRINENSYEEEVYSGVKKLLP